MRYAIIERVVVDNLEENVFESILQTRSVVFFLYSSMLCLWSQKVKGGVPISGIDVTLRQRTISVNFLLLSEEPFL